MSNQAPPPGPDDHPETVTRNARYGIILFTIYTLIYAAFVGISAFAPQVMAKPVLGGVNLAVVYGFGLIVLAFAMALVYMFLCARGDDGSRR